MKAMYMNIELFEQKLAEWNAADEATRGSPWGWMEILPDEYYYWLYRLESEKQTKKQDEYNVDAMSIVYFFLLLCVGAVSFWIGLMLLKAFVL